MQNNSVVIQDSCENNTTAIQCWGHDPLWLDNSSLLLTDLLCSVLVCSRKTFLMFQLTREMQSSAERGSVFQQPEGSWLIYTEVPTRVGWLVHPHADEVSKSSQFDWSKRHCSDWSQQSCFGWSKLHSSDQMGKASVLLVDTGFQELLYKAWFRWQKQLRQVVQHRCR